MLKQIRDYSRRTYLINKGLQTKFIAGFSSAVFLGFVFNMFVVYFLIDRELNRELYKIHLTIRTTSDIAVPIILKLGAITIPLIVAVSALIGFMLTRRVEVPLLSFKEAVRKAAGKDLTARVPDELPTALPDGFNSMTESIEASFSYLKNSFSEIETHSRRLDPRPGGAPCSRGEIKLALNGIHGARERMGLALARFKV